jgi:hypothetical protein
MKKTCRFSKDRIPAGFWGIWMYTDAIDPDKIVQVLFLFGNQFLIFDPLTAKKMRYP